MEQNSSEQISIFGGGLVGSLLSILLAKLGLDVSLFEKRQDLRKLDNWEEGRSINLAMSHRGWKALEMVGLGEEVNEIAVPMYARIIHNADGTTYEQPYGKEGQAIYSVSRGHLNQKLFDIAEKYENVKLNFNKRCLNISLKTATAIIEDTRTNQVEEVQADCIFGADGAFSIVRSVMQKTNRFNYSQQFIEHGYKELTIPAKDGKWQLPHNGLHIWPRGNFMLIALPNTDGTFTCTLFLAFEGDISFEQLEDKNSMLTFFEQYFPDVIPLMPNLAKEFFDNPTSSLVNIACYPWAYAHKVALIGDAAHAIVPFYGQGMNCGFEDCAILYEILEKYPEKERDWKTILQEYQVSRKPNADAISELAMQNFVEMRDKVADPVFLLRKKIEAHINQFYPEYWTPLYSLVTFTHTPYAEALEMGKKQDKIMDKIMEIDNIENIWETLDYGSILKFHKAMAGE